MKLHQYTLPAFGLVVALALGFLAGRMSKTDKHEITNSDSQHSDSYRSSTRKGTSNSARRPARRQPQKKNIRRTMKTMIAQLERSPMVQMDFDGMFAIWETMRNFSETDIHQALESIAGIKKKPQTKMIM